MQVRDPIAAAEVGARDRAATLRRILAAARPDAALLAGATALLFVAAATTLAYPQGMRLVIDAAMQGRSGRLREVAIAMLVVAVIQGVASGGRAALLQIAGERIALRIRTQLYSHLVAQEVAFFDVRRVGDLTSTLSYDAMMLQWTATSSIAISLRHVAMVIGGMVLLLYTSVALTGVMLAVVPPVALGALLYGRRIQRLSQERHRALGVANAMADEALGSIRTVRLFSGEAHEVARYGGTLRRAYEAAVRAARASGTLVGGGYMGVYGSAAVVLWVGGKLLSDGRLTAGQLTSFLVYTLMVALSVQALSEEWGEVMRTLGASTRLFALLDRAPEMPISGGRKLDHVAGAISLERAAFRYPARPDVEVLHGIDLGIAPGEVVALVGPSGSGKSTIAALIGRLYDPVAGRVCLDGVDLRDLDPSWLRGQIGIVSQEPLLFATSICENIAYGRRSATALEVERAAQIAHAHEFIASFPRGYDTEVGERGVQLSGGQKQRIAIARAILKDAPVLILDEATSALDAESEVAVRDALETLVQGRATLVIAHRLSTVRSATRVVVLDGGRIVQVGTHLELVRQEGPYRRLVERQLITT